jgi:hypothetical protein
LAAAGAVFVLLQVLNPIHQAVSANLGDRTRRGSTTAHRSLRAPPGMGHLEDPRTHQRPHVARDFDLG